MQSNVREVGSECCLHVSAHRARHGDAQGSVTLLDFWPLLGSLYTFGLYPAKLCWDQSQGVGIRKHPHPG